MKVPLLIKSIKTIKEKALEAKRPLGFVPTMGYLHDGHLSLVRTAAEECDSVVVSIYVNPAQFGQNEDLDKYPRDLDKDLKKLAKLEVDYVFLPSDREMYPDDHRTWVSVEELTASLCGKTRPGHFRGVATIVTKLLNIIRPDTMYLGEKDFQQLVVLKKMVQDLNLETNVTGCPLIREADGLAMSSRNKYLTPEGRKRATVLYKTLMKAKSSFTQGITDFSLVRSDMMQILSDKADRIEYIEAVDPLNLKPVNKLTAETRILVAAYIENTRLIDNIALR